MKHIHPCPRGANFPTCKMTHSSLNLSNNQMCKHVFIFKYKYEYRLRHQYEIYPSLSKRCKLPHLSDDSLLPQFVNNPCNLEICLQIKAVRKHTGENIHFGPISANFLFCKCTKHLTMSISHDILLAYQTVNQIMLSVVGIKLGSRRCKQM